MPAGLHRFTFGDVLRMAEVGILEESEHVELLDGVLCTVTREGPSHATLSVVVGDALRKVYGQGAHLRSHTNVHLDDYDAPELDVAVVRGPATDYFERLPSGADLVLVVEVSVTSQQRDRGKAHTYARHGVPEYWLLDVPARELAVHRRPMQDGYMDVRTLTPDDEVELPEADVRWRVGVLLG